MTEKQDVEVVNGENEKAVVLYEGDMETEEAKTALARYQSSKELAIMGTRVSLLSKARGIELTPEEGLFIASMALSHDLDPIFELQWWKSGNKLSVMKSKVGKERHAHEAALRNDTYLMPPRYRELTAAEKTKLEIPQDALTQLAQVEDYRATQDWINNHIELAKIGYTPKEIDEKIGPKPVHFGIGVMHQEEMWDIDNPRWYHKCKERPDLNTKWQKRELRGFDPCEDCGYKSSAKPQKWSHAERTRKRAYSAAIDKWASRLDVGKIAQGAPADVDDYVLEGVFEVMDQQEGLFGEEPPPPPSPTRTKAKPKKAAAPPKNDIEAALLQIKTNAGHIQRDKPISTDEANEITEIMRVALGDDLADKANGVFMAIAGDPHPINWNPPGWLVSIRSWLGCLKVGNAWQVKDSAAAIARQIAQGLED